MGVTGGTGTGASCDPRALPHVTEEQNCDLQGVSPLRTQRLAVVLGPAILLEDWQSASA